MATKSRTVVDVNDPVMTMAQIYARVFSSPDGRLVLEDLRKSFGDRTSFVAGDPYAAAFKEGSRHVFLSVLDLLALAADPDRRVRVEDDA
jgi:hypothetical protein